MFHGSRKIRNMTETTPSTRRLPSTPDGILEATTALRAGAVVGIPTETVYGLAAVLFDESALAEVFAAKARPTFDPLIVHVAPTTFAEDELTGCTGLIQQGLVDPARLTPAMTRWADALMANFWPGPLTLVLPKAAGVPDLATSGLDTVAVRMPAHPVAQALIRGAGAPLVAPSANRFGRISPTSAEDVLAELEGRIPFVVDGGPCSVGIESTVVWVREEGVMLLRPGGVPIEQLDHVLAEVGGPAVGRGSPSSHAAPMAPGLLEKHYAPATPLFILPDGWRSDGSTPLETALAAAIAASVGSSFGARVGLGLLLVILPTGDVAVGATLDEPMALRIAAIRTLSEGGDASEGARTLFSALRSLDEDPAVKVIWAERWPGGASGLGWAINDRLQRAAAGSRPE